MPTSVSFDGSSTLVTTTVVSIPPSPPLNSLTVEFHMTLILPFASTASASTYGNGQGEVGEQGAGKMEGGVHRLEVVGGTRGDCMRARALEARNESRRWMSTTEEEVRASTSASSMAVSPPPTTTTGLPLRRRKAREGAQMGGGGETRRGGVGHL